MNLYEAFGKYFSTSALLGYFVVNVVFKNGLFFCMWLGLFLSAALLWLFPFQVVAEASGTWNSTGWVLYDTITIDHSNIDDDLTDFPVYVDLSDLSDQFWNNVSASGGDIRVTTNAGVPVELPREVVFASTTLQTGELHFKASLISASNDTSFRIYYNGVAADYDQSSTYGAENVWTNGYVGVWHNQDASVLSDSTVFGNDATPVGSLATTTGVIGAAIDYSPNNNYAQAANANSLNITEAITLSAWVNIPEWPSDVTGLQVLGKGNCSYALRRDGSSSRLAFMIRDGSCSDIGAGSWGLITGSLAENQWYHVVGTWDGVTQRIYVDGVEVNSISAMGTIGTSTDGVQFGAWRSGGGSPERFWPGFSDENRLANVARSAAWIKAEHLNQASTTSFYSVSDNTWNPTDWTLYDTITIDHSNIDDDLTDFPVYVDLSDLSDEFWNGVRSDGGDIRVIRPPSGNSGLESVVLASTTKPGNEVYTVAWDSESQYVAVGINSFIRLYKLVDGELVEVDFVTGSVNSFLFIHELNWNGDYLAASFIGSNSPAYHLSLLKLDRDADTLTEIHIPDQPPEKSFANAWNGNFLAVGTSDWVGGDGQNLTLYELNTSTEELEMLTNPTPPPAGLRSLDWNGNYLAVGVANTFTTAGQKLHLYELDGGSLTKLTDPVDDVEIDVIALSWNGDFLAAKDTRDNLYLYELVAGELVQREIISLPSAADNTGLSWYANYLVVSHAGGDNLYIYELVDGELIAVEDIPSPDHRGFSSSWSPDGRYLVVGGSDSSNGTNSDLYLYETHFEDGESAFEQPYELVSIDTAAKTGELHFRADRLSSTNDTTFYIYWNGISEGYARTDTYGAENVWSNGYVGVWHLNEDPTGVIIDSTANRNDGVGGSAMTSGDLVDGKVGQGLRLSGGSNQYVEIDSTTELTDISPITVCTWYRHNSFNTLYDPIISKTDIGAGPSGWDLYAGSFEGGNYGFSSMSGYFVQPTASFNSEQWYHICGSWDGTTGTSAGISAYRDGVNTSVPPGFEGFFSSPGTSDASFNLYFGAREGSGDLDGVIDGVRISNVDRSDSWVKAEYLNQATTTDFYNVSTTAFITFGDTTVAQDSLDSITATSTILSNGGKEIFRRGFVVATGTNAMLTLEDEGVVVQEQSLAGEVWVDRNSAAAAGSTNLRAAAIGPNGEMLAVGESGFIRTSTDGGTSWVDRSIAADVDLSNLNGAAIGPNGEMLVVGADSLVLTSTDDGATWTNSGTAPEWEGYWSAAIGPDDEMLITGQTYLNTSADGGQTWTSRMLEADYFGVGNQSDGAIGPNGEMLVVGANGYIRTSTDGGDNWTDRSTAASSGSTNLRGASIGPNGEMLVVGADGYIRTFATLFFDLETYSLTISSLDPAIAYTVRPFAENADGVFYGASVIYAPTLNLAIQNHALGQVENGYGSDNSSLVTPLYRFALDAEEVSLSDFTVSSVALQLEDIAGMSTGSFGTVRLYRDVGITGVYNAGADALVSTGVVELSSNNRSGTIVFPMEEIVAASNVVSYVVVAENALAFPGAGATVSLSANSLSAATVDEQFNTFISGSAALVRHERADARINFRRSGGGGGTISRTGGAETTPERFSPDSGESLTLQTGEFLATSAGGVEDDWSNATAAFVADEQYATASTNGAQQSYTGFGWNIPLSNQVTGLQIRLLAASEQDTSGIEVAYTTDGGTSYSTVKTTTGLTTEGVVYTLGGNGDLWDGSLTPAQVMSEDFHVVVTAQTDGGLVFLDALAVRIYHLAGGGGGGSGGRF